MATHTPIALEIENSEDLVNVSLEIEDRVCPYSIVGATARALTHCMIAAATSLSRPAKPW